MKSLVTAIVVSLAFAVARFIVPVEGSIQRDDVFKDLAHLWVGGLFGAWAFSLHRTRYDLVPGCVYFLLGLGLTALEVVAFFVRKS